MRVLVSTMGKHLEIGANLIELLKTKMSFDRIGFLVADSKFYKQFNKKNSFIKDNNVCVIKEWEYTDITKVKEPDWARIASYEKKIGDPCLWNALLSDRRIFFGRYSKSKQHYSPQFSYKELMIILDQALCMMDEFFQNQSPDLVLSFGTSIMGDYLIYLFCRYYKIPYYQLKATKVDNYITLHDTPLGISSNIVKNYNTGTISGDIKDQAKAYIESVKTKGLKYEGAILSSRSRLIKKLKSAPMNQLKSIYHSITNYMDPVIRNDCHIHSGFIPSLYENFITPLNFIKIEKKLKKTKRYLSISALENIGDFVFFPLHFEPEVSLQVFGRPYQNQIELIRNIALNIPVGMKIVVKEHPRSLGFRSFSYYRKLIEIPNVLFVEPFVKSFQIIPYAKLIAVITGSIGLEAAMLEKPVITFGHVAYNILPDKMVRNIKNLNLLGNEINDLVEHYEYDSNSLVNFVSSLIKISIPVDLYTVLLNKKNRYAQIREELSKDDRFEHEYHQLTNFILEKVKSIPCSDGQFEAHSQTG